MTRLLFILIIVFSALNPLRNASSQTTGDRNDPAFSPRLSGEVVNYNLPTKGSPYLYQDWLPGSVLLYCGESINVAGLRYNGYHNTIVWRHPKTHNHIRLDDQLIKEFKLNHPQATARFIRFNAPGTNDPIWAECLFNEKITLLARRHIEQTGSEVQHHEGSMVSLPVLEPRPVYYVINKSGHIARINRLNRRNLQNAFPGFEQEVRELLRQHNLRTQNETELLEAVHLINDMLTQESR